MLFLNDTYNKFVNRITGKKIILFGASSLWNYYIRIFADIDTQVLDHTLFIVDNDSAKQGIISDIAGRKLKIESVEALFNQQNYIILIVVSMAYQEEICKQLASLDIPLNTECYSLPLMIYHQRTADNSCVESYFAEHISSNIPKIIHSFWFSGEEKPDIYKRCLESWHRHCPDYEIIEWNSNNYDIAKNQYMKEAYERKKWAFVSDYARLDVIYEHGGIYLDMDVELLSSIDRLRNAKAFFCRQEDGFIELGSGFGAPQRNEFIGEMLAEYTGKTFLDSEGAMDMTPQPQRMAGVFERHGISICHDSEIIKDMIFLSNDYITCGQTAEALESKDTRLGVHWHNAGWLSDEKRNVFKKSSEIMPVLQKKYFKETADFE
ncbi:MAG: hypothetical protein HFH87_13075 [Lachnospiraceae bacterium]|nr:hypothetical protein [Lachnospiraceae bacterium]